MKLIKRLFYLIITLILICCGAVLICALNPSLTEALTDALYGTEKEAPVEAVGAETVGNAETLENIVPEIIGTSDYVPPSQNDLQLPEKVYGLNGYQPVQGKEQQLAEEEAESLASTLQTGNIGEDLQFDGEKYPYYSMLDESARQLYRQIYANALEAKTSFAPAMAVSVNRVKNVIEAVYNDHPELFWLDTSYSCKYKPNGECIQITLQYNTTVNSLEDAKQNFYSNAQAIIDGAKQFPSVLEKEKYVHDMLLAKVEYDPLAAMNQSAYSAMVNGESVCAGYARAFQYIMQELGVPCYYCTGYSGEDHAWNIVKLDKGYYNVDVTWDDTNPATYDYYNKTDREYADTHVRTNLSVYLPACNGPSMSDGAMDGEASADGESQEAENAENVIEYINPDPQEPMRYTGNTFGNNEEREKKQNLEKAGITEDEVLQDMQEYYDDCIKQMKEVGVGQKYFSNVVPVDLWASIEQAYSNGDYQKGYVEEVLKELKLENFAIQLQVDDLSGGYYRIYHNVSTW